MCSCLRARELRDVLAQEVQRLDQHPVGLAASLRNKTNVNNMCIHIYIYIYIERERCVYIYIYIYIHINIRRIY